MSVYSAGSSSRSSAGNPPTGGRPQGRGDQTRNPIGRGAPDRANLRRSALGPGGPDRGPAGQPPSPLAWAKQRFGGRTTRRATGTVQRAENQLEQLGPAWQVVEWPEGVAADDDHHTGFLAIGPGGVYAVTVVDHGRHRVMLAGDVVQIHGKRPPHVARARKAAKEVSTALTAAVGTSVPVVPVLTFVGSGALTAHGLPTGCLVVSHRELDKVLLAAGNKITAVTARKLADVASHPATWADRYRWYPDSQTASDKGAARR